MSVSTIRQSCHPDIALTVIPEQGNEEQIACWKKCARVSQITLSGGLVMTLIGAFAKDQVIVPVFATGGGLLAIGLIAFCSGRCLLSPRP